MKKQKIFILITGLLIIISTFSFIQAQEIVPNNPGKPLNSTIDDFAPSISPDGSFMVFNSKRDGQKFQDIYISYFKNGIWSKPVPLTVINSPYNDETPFIADNGKIILFASDRDGSKEMPRDRNGRVRVSFDIYWSHKTDKGWTKPVPVPGNINTMHHERSPSLSLNKKIIFYTTWPFATKNKAKIMMSKWNGLGYNNTHMMPAPINSGYMDMALIQTKEGFYFSSMRPGGMGGWDIYFVSFKNGKLGKAINMGPPINSKGNDFFYSNNNNVSYFCSNRKNSIGRFDIYKAGFVIHAIYFDYNSAKIKQESFVILDKIVSFLKKHKTLRFDIIGHTDLHASHEYNDKLSLERAQAVKDYLIQKGLNNSRFTVKGLGKREPIINKTGPQFDPKNRRTEFKVSGTINN